MTATVKNGKGKMKPIAGLSDAQIKDVVTYSARSSRQYNQTGMNDKARRSPAGYPSLQTGE